MDLDRVRDLDLQDFYAHLRMCLVHDTIDKEFQARLAGALSDEGAEKDTNTNDSEFHIPSKRETKGPYTETKREHTHLTEKVGSLVMDKRTGKVINYQQGEKNEIAS